MLYNHKYASQTLILILAFFVLQDIVAQQRSLLDYQTIARQNNPILKQNTNLQQILLIQNTIIKAQYTAPQVYFSSDLMLAPFFFNNNTFFSITNAPSDKAIGYNGGLTNGALYSAQWNVSKNFFNEKTIQTLFA